MATKNKITYLNIGKITSTPPSTNSRIHEYANIVNFESSGRYKPMVGAQFKLSTVKLLVLFSVKLYIFLQGQLKNTFFKWKRDLNVHSKLS